MANLRRFNPLLWIIALAIINGAWNSVADGEAIHEINDKEHSTEDRTIEISSVFGLIKKSQLHFLLNSSLRVPIVNLPLGKLQIVMDKLLQIGKV